MEYIMFPMKTLQISQGVNGSFTHQGACAIDITGKDSGIEPTYAPVTMKIMRIEGYNQANAVFAESVDKVQFADGSVDYASFMFLHDNYVGDIALGRVFKQGEEFGDEGTAGYATGNHCHLEVKKGKLVWNKCGDGYLYYGLNSYGVWHLQDSISPDKAFFVDGVTLINGGQPYGSGNRMSWKYKKDVNKTTTTTTSKPATATSTVSWDYNAIVKVGNRVKSKSCAIAVYPGTNSAIKNGCVYCPELGGLVPLAHVSEASDSKDGKVDNCLSNTGARITLDECSVEAVDTKNNLVKVHGYWIKAAPLAVKK